ncbi:hypothetical protein H696_03679 [Fonticula alba]|uniref:Uncharacterized protein n=1 Tax=Fonticula alba TaxID=691883 RepID=A0A058Z5N6_FONAL|nr:hypothetical protein H696_03679 [Fonticula alba]KCV69253.1 hypothetical protein H696_03679 [Fonticula alba]|eukprot:XP_009495818.1 hypothetical protein H696_03679 [Fonticula alba]
MGRGLRTNTKFINPKKVVRDRIHAKRDSSGISRSRAISNPNANTTLSGKAARRLRIAAKNAEADKVRKAMLAGAAAALKASAMDVDGAASKKKAQSTTATDAAPSGDKDMAASE